jgi:hypothetical protein
LKKKRCKSCKDWFQQKNVFDICCGDKCDKAHKASKIAATNKPKERIKGGAHPLRKSAKMAPYCFGCGLANYDGARLCLAHSNELKNGKGRGIKASDSTGAIVCFDCHNRCDGREGWQTQSREEMQKFHHDAHLKTLSWWIENGFLPVPGQDNV